MKAIQNNNGSVESASKQHIKGSNGMINARLYYYLLDSEFEEVLNRKLISTADYYFDHNPCSFVWLTSNPQWEQYMVWESNNVDKLVFGISDFAAIIKKHAPFRIQIDARIPLYNLNNCLAHINPSVSDAAISIFNKHLISTGLHPKQWRCSLEPIPSMYWCGIEYWDCSQSHWLPYPDWSPAESMIYITDHEHAIQEITTKMSMVESERDKFKSEVIGLKASINSKDERIASLESSNSKSKQETEESMKRLQYFLATHTESALEQKIKKIEEEKDSESSENEGLKESLDKANETTLEKDRALDAQKGYVQYLQTILRTRGITFNEHYGHEKNKAA